MSKNKLKNILAIRVRFIVVLSLFISKLRDE